MESFNSLSPVIQSHIRQLAAASGLPAGEESLELLAGAWMDKKQCFEEALAANDLTDTQFFDKTESRGALVMTWSGSLLQIGPLVNGNRRCEYTSIGLRTDVPPSAVEDFSVLAADVETDNQVHFATGPIKQSSPVLKIGVYPAEISPGEGEALLTRISQEVTEEFIEVNKTVAQ